MARKWVIVINLLLVGYLNLIDSKLSNIIELFAQVQNAGLEYKIKEVTVSNRVKFKCRTVNSHKEFNLNRKKKATIRKLKRSYPLAFIIHGWADGPTNDWLQESLAGWITHQPANVCIVDWSFYARKDYKAAMMNIFDVGKTIAKVIKSLESHGFSRRNTTLVGYSLGAHIAGFAGHILKGKIGEIIGLDPAGPLFTMPVDIGSKYRLDPTDAKFVQVMHTSGGTLGTHVKCGHADFYPNGGASPQTNCVHKTITNESRRNPVGCSHSMVVKFFKLSINPELLFVGYECPSYGLYISGMCKKNKKSRFGIHSDRIPGNYFFRTKATAPYVKKGFFKSN